MGDGNFSLICSWQTLISMIGLRVSKENFDYIHLLQHMELIKQYRISHF